MSYLVLARKWRPKTFTELVGQEAISRILVNAIEQKRIPHAYLFSGPRGVGKTTTARILAKALNCVEGPTPKPCGVCSSCESIANGSSVDVIEIDGASNNSVEDIRDLREKVKYAPSSGTYKVYIIDEVHMLSTSAFNALLKTLEEPPPHVVFVLATTEMKKIPATVLSRCQHMPFRRISAAEIKARLTEIAAAEGIVASPHALAMIARAADGGMRDSLTIMDQLFSFSAEISEDTVKTLLGITDVALLIGVSRAILAGDRPGILSAVRELGEQGTDFRAFVKELVEFFRDLLVASVLGDPAEAADLSDDERTAMADLLALTSEDQLTVILQDLLKTDAEVRNASSPRLALEVALVRASFLSSLTPLKDALARIEQFGGGPLPASRPSASVPSAPAQRRPAPAPKAEEPPAAASKNTPAAPKSAAAPAPKPENKKAAAPSADLMSCWNRTLERLDPRLASKFSHASVSIEGDSVMLTLNGGHAVFAADIEKNLAEVKAMLAEDAGCPVLVKIAISEKKTVQLNDLRETVKKEPMIRDALELFEGRIVDVIPVENGNDGGPDVEEDVE